MYRTALEILFKLMVVCELMGSQAVFGRAGMEPPLFIGPDTDQVNDNDAARVPGRCWSCADYVLTMCRPCTDHVPTMY